MHSGKSRHDTPLAETPLTWAPCFIEHQFPVAKVSMESYKERKANYSQTLTGLGKWWGRKPLVMIRAAILGLLMPPSDDPAKDREIFLKLMTMDADGLKRRKKSRIPADVIFDYATRSERQTFFRSETPTWKTDPEIAHAVMQPVEADQLFEGEPTAGNSNLIEGPTRRDEQDRLREARQWAKDAKEALELRSFERLPYSRKLEYCLRPEQLDGPSPEAWEEINLHLKTTASSLPELVEQLGARRFGHRPKVGDSFCGAGSVPFEAARLGCDAYGSDLNPVAALLTWAALNIVGGGTEVASQVKMAQEEIYRAVDRQVTEWGIEHNELGWRADAYLYCVEVRDPESGWMVPLAPSWVIGEKTRTVAKLVPDATNERYDIEIHQGVSNEEMKAAKESGTARDSRLIPPNGGQSTPIEVVRRNLRMWDNEDLVPRPDDVFQERLYCIRWVETYSDAQGKERTRRHYRAPTDEDLDREGRVLELLRERFHDWQEKGYLPSREIKPGYNTTQPIRERGWTHWHHLFTPRQLLILGLFQQNATSSSKYGGRSTRMESLLELGRLIDTKGLGSKLLRWNSHPSKEMHATVFSNQALNTLSNYCQRTLHVIDIPDEKASKILGSTSVLPTDARSTMTRCDLWLTDPPYADAINYHELSEYFLAWYEKPLFELLPGWYTDSKRDLAVKGNDESFRQSMVACYRRLTECMPDNGLQVVMFTHQDAAVWADLTMILWAAGLRVTAAWCIATETDSALKKGNYVQGTVLLVCRKCTEKEPVFLDEIAHRVEAEVKLQLDSMQALEDDSDPNFGDADYQLAAYAAALRVLTERPLEDIDPAREIIRVRRPGEENPVEQLIRNAVKIACDHLVPRGLERELWKTLSPQERFYLKGLEVESHGEYRSGVYQELARGFGVPDYGDLLENTRANETRLKTANEFGTRNLSSGGFGNSLVRQILFAVHQAVRSEQARDGMNWLKTEIGDYWANRERIIEILEFLAGLGRISGMAHWRTDAEVAKLLAGALRNDHL